MLSGRNDGGAAATRGWVHKVSVDVGLAVIYIAAGTLGLTMDAVSGFATLVWPPAGIALAVLLIGGPRYWRGVALGAFVVNLLAGAPLVVALGISAGNTLEALAAAYGIHRIVGRPVSLGRLRDVVSLLCIGAIGAAAIGATAGALSLLVGGVVTASKLASTWTAWWLGDAIGILVVTPPLLAIWAQPKVRRPQRVLEIVLLAAAVIASGAAVFGPSLVFRSYELRLYRLFPVLVWAAVRFGHRGAAAATFGLVSIAVLGTASGYGPFTAVPLHERLTELQIFMFMMASTGLLLGASKTEMEASKHRASEARMEAEAASRAKDEFLALLGHELRNPLSPIVTAIDLMKLRGAWQDSKEQRVIERQVHHLGRLVDDLLDVSRVTRGKIELHRELVEVADVVASALETASPHLENGGHVVSVDVPKHGLCVNGDAFRLGQMIANLLNNAAKYSPSGSHIDVSARRSGPSIEICVRDDGHGISPELLPFIFNPFVQAPTSSDRAPGGLGLGLALVRGIAELHEGTVVAQSEGPGKGAAFLIRLPAETREAVAAAASPSPNVTARASLRVLVVDDNRDAAELLGSLLANAGHEVTLAFDPLEALAVVERKAPEVAVLDIGLPIMDGYELARRIRELLPSACPRLIAVTGYGQENDRTRSEAAGFDAHFVKPVSGPAVLEAIGSSSAAQR